MEYTYRILYFDLLPPPPFLREVNKIFSCATICLGALAMAWSLGSFSGQNAGIVADVLVLGMAFATAWYFCLTVLSIWKLKRYRAAAHNVDGRIYWLLYPWICSLLICFTILLAAVTDNLNIGWNLRENLYKLVGAQLLPFAAFEIPVIKNWLPPLDIRHFPHIFRKSLSILLGREATTEIENHARNVVQFQVDFMNFTESNAKVIETPSPQVYYDAELLHAFQESLGCLYSTPALVGKQLGSEFKDRQWSLVDIGCGEGTFTRELLSNMGETPESIVALDPSRPNLDQYRGLMMKEFPGIRQIDVIQGSVESKLDELSVPNLLLASHSLYAVLDNNKREADRVVAELIKHCQDGVVVFLLASSDSYLYTVKKAVLNALRRPDRSSYGEDLAELIKVHAIPTIRNIDSYVDVTPLLSNRKLLISWMSYFCRLTPEDLDGHFELCQGILRNAAIEVRSLPEVDRARLKQSNFFRLRHLTDQSRVIYHREVLITVPSTA